MPRWYIYWNCHVSHVHEVEADTFNQAVEISERTADIPNLNHTNVGIELDGDREINVDACSKVDDGQ